jgi:hypothetical protein
MHYNTLHSTYLLLQAYHVSFCKVPLKHYTDTPATRCTFIHVLKAMPALCEHFSCFKRELISVSAPSKPLELLQISANYYACPISPLCLLQTSVNYYACPMAPLSLLQTSANYYACPMAPLCLLQTSANTASNKIAAGQVLEHSYNCKNLHPAGWMACECTSKSCTS